jgi:hypothetical protein
MEIAEIKAQIKSIIRSHPSGCCNLAQLRKDLKAFAQIDLDCFIRGHFGNCDILSAIKQLGEFKVQFLANTAFIYTIDTDHIQELNRYYTQEESDNEEDDGIFVFKAPCSNPFSIAGSSQE